MVTEETADAEQGDDPWCKSSRRLGNAEMGIRENSAHAFDRSLVPNGCKKPANCGLFSRVRLSYRERRDCVVVRPVCRELVSNDKFPVICSPSLDAKRCHSGAQVLRVITVSDLCIKAKRVSDPDMPSRRREASPCPHDVAGVIGNRIVTMPASASQLGQWISPIGRFFFFSVHALPVN